MTREEFETSMLEFSTADVEAQAEKLIAIVEVYAKKLEEIAALTAERDELKEKYMAAFLEDNRAEVETAVTDEALTSNGVPEEAIAIEEYVDLA